MTYVRAAVMVAVTAILLVVESGGQLFQALQPLPEKAAESVPRFDPTPAEPPALAHLFVPEPSQAPAAGTPASRESWISDAYGIALKGTVPGAAAVVMELSTGRERLVHPGEDTGSFTVREITRNRLVIDGTRGRETLLLPSDARDLQPTAFRRLTALDRRELVALAGNVDRFASEASLKPVRAAAGGIAGYRIVRLKPEGILYRMGLRKNDIIESVNGRTPGSPEDIYRVLESAVHDNRLVLTIRRDHRVQRYTYQIR